MVELFSLSLGVLSTLFSFKIGKLCYRLYPYLTKSPILSETPSKECIIIAGATDGIGLEYTRLLSQHYRIIALGRNPQKLSDLQQQISPNILTSKVDFMDQCLKDQLIASGANEALSLSQNLKIKGIINCVGVSSFAPFPKTSIDQMVKINHTNIESIIYLLKMIYIFKEGGNLASKPFFLNISSVAAKYPRKYSNAYSGSKAYISAMMDVMSKEQTSISFLDVKPWFVKTKMVGYINTWDSVLPQDLAEESLRLLGKRGDGCGTIKHELVEQFRFFTEKIIVRRTQELQARIQKINNMKNNRNKKQ